MKEVQVLELPGLDCIPETRDSEGDRRALSDYG